MMASQTSAAAPVSVNPGLEEGRAGDAGLFGPASLTWRLHREAALLVGGRRALLMQIAHPAVAAAVRDHSRYASAPLGRLVNTLNRMHCLVFADTPGALAAARVVNTVHRRVEGRLGWSAGGFADQKPYTARDPRALLWVYLTLIDTTIRVYDGLVAPLAPWARERYYQESQEIARLMNVPQELLPNTCEDMQRLVVRMLEDGEVAVTPAARRIARALLHPPFALVPRRLWTLVNPVTVGLLPPKLRDGYGLRFGLVQRTAFSLAMGSLRAAIPLLPRSLTMVPHAWWAERQLEARPGRALV